MEKLTTCNRKPWLNNKLCAFEVRIDFESETTSKKNKSASERKWLNDRMKIVLRLG